MALVSLSASGLWSAATPWPNGNKPTTLDDVYSNGFTVYIDQNVTVNSINSNGGTFRNAGNFTLNANVSAGTSTCLTLTGNGTNTFVVSGTNIIASKSTVNIYAIYSTVNAFTKTLALTTIGNVVGGAVNSNDAIRIEGGNYTHIGSSIGGTNNNCAGINFSNSNNYPAIIFLSGGPFSAGSGNTSSGFTTQTNLAGPSLNSSSITIIGTCSGGPGSGGGGTTAGIYSTSNMPINVTGNVYGGIGFGFAATGAATHNIVGTVYSGPAGGVGNVGVLNGGSTTTINITGDVYSVNTSNNPTYGVQISQTGTVNIVGNIFGSPATNTGAAVYSNNNNRITITGNVSAGNTSNAYGVHLNNVSYFTLFGNVTGGAGSGAFGVYNNNTGYAVISGIAQGGTVADGVRNNSTGTVYVKRAKANAYGPGSAVTSIAYGVYTSSQGGNSIVEELEFGANGLVPTFGNIVLRDLATNVVDFYTTAGGRKTLIDPNSGSIMPPVSSVRLGVSYSGDNLVGTCAMPSISSVDFGTAVDNDTGIAALFANDVWGTTNNTLTAASLSATIGYRLNNAATTQTVGNLIAAYNT